MSEGSSEVLAPKRNWEDASTVEAEDLVKQVVTGDGTDAMSGLKTGIMAGRRDGRSAGEMRGLVATQGVLTEADGSGRIAIGKTEVLAAVYGPMHCSLSKQQVDDAVVSVKVKIAGGLGQAAFEHDIKGFVKDSIQLQHAPRKAIAVIVHVLADDGGLVAAAANAVTLAMLDSGLPMKRCITAASLAVVDGDILIDPTTAEEADSNAQCIFAYNVLAKTNTAFRLSRVTGDISGHFSFAKTSRAAREAALKTYGFLRSAVEKKVETESKYLYPNQP